VRKDDRQVSPLAALAITGAGFAAGTINTVVGSGSLITFPVLIALGYGSLVANVTNTVGLVAGSVSGAYGYRRELVGQRARVLRLGAVAATGGLTGGVLLLLAPKAFAAVVPALIIAAALLMAIQPRLAARLRRRADPSSAGRGRAVALVTGVALTAVYGGYFGAAQGVLLLALLGTLLTDDLQRLNGLKNVLAGIVNGVAAVLFACTGDVRWSVAGLLALGAVVGGQVGAAAARRVPAVVLRAVVVVGGLTVGLVLALR